MRSSRGTNFGLARSVVSRTKSRIACLADPSFHDGNGPLEAVSADAEMDKGGADTAGSNANVVSRVRRSMPFGRSRKTGSKWPIRAVPVGTAVSSSLMGLVLSLGFSSDRQLRVLRDARGPDR